MLYSYMNGSAEGLFTPASNKWIMRCATSLRWLQCH